MNDSAAATSRRADAYALVFALVFPTLVTWVYFVLLAGRGTTMQVAYGLGKGIQFAFPLVWVLAVQRRRLRIGLPPKAGLLESVAFGGLIFAAILLMYHTWLKPFGFLAAAAVEVTAKIDGFGANSPLKYLALGAFYSLGHSFLEEYYWRWFVFAQLRRLMPLGPAIAVSSLGFMAHHVLVLGTLFDWAFLPVTLFSLAVAVGGAVWAWLYHRSGSLYGPWFSHVLVDAAIFAIGYDMARGLFG